MFAKLVEVFKPILSKAFDIREGEYETAILLQLDIFLIISTLLIVKPTVSALFLSKFGAERLPEAFILVALTAIITTTLYAKQLSRNSLKSVIVQTLAFSIFVLIVFGMLLHLNFLEDWVLYLFYIWVAIFAVLSASQFWILVNLVYHVRQAKRLFGFIGAGAIAGGIFGGYLTSVLAPILGSENLLFVAAMFLVFCIPITGRVWKTDVEHLNIYRRKKRTVGFEDSPLRIIKNSRHLTYLACIIGLSVVVAKLVDYQFSDVASSKIEDPDELASFFGFWFSNLNLISLLIQLFLTSRLVGRWGVGSSLLILPAGILCGAVTFLIVPELWAAILIKSADGSLKQSINRSATELLSLPIPYELKKKTKTFIDVVVDSIATGIAGIILIFIVQGMGLSSQWISMAIIVLICVWAYIAYLVRIEYIKLFKSKVESSSTSNKLKQVESRESVIAGIKKVLEQGNQGQMLYMLRKTKEFKDERLFENFKKLIHHDSPEVRAEALINLDYYKKDLTDVVKKLIYDANEAVSLAAFQYIFERSEDKGQDLLQTYLNHQNKVIADNALLCLAIETRNNEKLKKQFFLENRIEKRINSINESSTELEIIRLLDMLGSVNIEKFNPVILTYFNHKNEAVIRSAVDNASKTFHSIFIPEIIELLRNKKYRIPAELALVNYGLPIIDTLVDLIDRKKVNLEIARFIPSVIEHFNEQKAVNALFLLQDHPDLTISIESLKSLNRIKETFPNLYFNKDAIATRILDSCKTYQNTLSAMHGEIIQSFKKKNTSQNQDDARRSLIDILERRLDGDLERIFRLLGLKYPFQDIFYAYEGIKSSINERRINAIEYLDNLLESSLKRVLIPIIETAIVDLDADHINKKVNALSEFECFELLLSGNDQRIKLAVLYLIEQLKDKSYMSLLEKYLESDNIKIKTFAQNAYKALM